MEVKVKLFSYLREVVGKKIISIKLDNEATVERLLEILADLYESEFKKEIFSKEGILKIVDANLDDVCLYSYSGSITTAVPVAEIKIVPWKTSEVSMSRPTTALAPSSRAFFFIRSIASTLAFSIS